MADEAGYGAAARAGGTGREMDTAMQAGMEGLALIVLAVLLGRLCGAGGFRRSRREEDTAATGVRPVRRRRPA